MLGLMIPCLKISGLQLCTERSHIIHFVFLSIAFLRGSLFEHAFKVSIKKVVYHYVYFVIFAGGGGKC